MFESQTRTAIFAYLDSEEIAWSLSAVAQAAEVLHAQGQIHRAPDSTTGTTGEFHYKGARLVVHPKPANPLTSAPPVQPAVEIVEHTQRFTIQ